MPNFPGISQNVINDIQNIIQGEFNNPMGINEHPANLTSNINQMPTNNPNQGE